MKIFNDMSLSEATDFYKKLEVEKERLINENKDFGLIKIALENINFYTDGLKQDY